MATLKFLRILFTVLAALCLAAILPIGSLLSGGWAVITLAAALVFFALMLLCKSGIEKQEDAKKPKQPTFFDPNPNGKTTESVQTETQSSVEQESNEK